MTVYYGGGGYGGEVDGNPWEGEVAPAGSVSRTLIRPAFSGSITPSADIDNDYITSSQSVSGSIALSGVLDVFANKYIVRELIPHTNDSQSWAFGDNYPETVDDQDEIGYIYLDGLTKFLSTTLIGGEIDISGTLITNHIQKNSVAGSVSPSGAVATTQYYMHTQSVSGSIVSDGESNSIIADPNNMDTLVVANAQNVIPRVKAYWSTGKFAMNLRGFSSSDIYQDKTLSMNPIVNWRFDEYSSPNQSVVLDSSKNNYNGVYVGNITGVSGSLSGPNSDSYGISLNGSSFLYANNNEDLNQVNNFQIEFWVKISSTPAYEMYICSKGNGSTNSKKQYAISIGTDKKLNAYAYSGSNEYKVGCLTPLTTGQWYHVIYSIEDRKLNLMVNGLKDGVDETISGDLNSTTGPIIIGRSSASSDYFIGSLDEFTMYSSIVMSSGGSAYARYRSGVNSGVYTTLNRFYPEQVMNGYSRVSYVWGVTDTKNSRGEIVTANGEVYTMEDKDSYRYEHGWWSRSISDTDGKMNFVETVLCEFDLHYANEIQVFTSEFFAGIKEFDIYYKNSSNQWILLNSGVNINSDEYNSIISLGALIQIKGVRVDVKTIWASEDIARVEEINPVYVSDISEDVVSFNIDQTRENFDSNIPIGSASANSLTLTLDNTGLKYSVYNQSGEYYELLLPDVKFEVELGWFGTEYNYVPKGTYWVDEWQESSDAMTVDARCRDYSKFLQETTNTGHIWFDTTGADAIADILKESNYPLYDIDVDRPYYDANIKNNAVGLWMMHEGDKNKYALDWPLDQSSGEANVHGIVDNGPDGDFTLMFWIRYPILDSPNASGIIDFRQIGGGNTDRVFVWNPSSIIVSIGSNDYSTGIKVDDNEWHNIAISWEQSTGSISVWDNCVLKSSGTTAAATSLNGKYDLYLGGGGLYGTKFYGTMGQIVLLGKTSIKQEISDMAFRNILASEKDVKIHYSHEEGYLDQPLEYTRVYSTISSKDKLVPNNVRFSRESFLTAENTTGRVSGTYYGEVDMGDDSSALHLEPYNKSAYFYGEKPSALFFDGNGTTGVSTQATATTTLVGDIDIFIRFSLSDITGNRFLVGQHPGSNGRNFSVGVDSSGKFKYTYSTNGATDTTVLTLHTISTYNIKPYDKVWLRVSHDVNDNMGGNKVTFYLSKEDTNDPTEISGWFELTRITNYGTITRHGSSADITVGMDSTGANKLFGYVYSLRITNGIDSDDVRMQFDPQNFVNKTMTSFYGYIGNLWNVNDAIPYAENNSFMYIAPNEVNDILDGSFSINIYACFKDNLGDYPLIAKEEFSSSSFSNIVSGGNPYKEPTQGTIEIGITSLGQVYVNSGLQESVVSAPVMQANQWHFISVVFDSDTNYVYIFIDSDEVGSAYFSSGFINNNLPWFIGTDARGRYLGSGANLCGLSMYNYRLVESKVYELYKSGGSLVPNKFEFLWGEEGETLWEMMLQVATADLGTFYFDDNNKFVYKNALNNYSTAFVEFSTPQWYFYDDIDIVSGSQAISLQSNKIVVKLSNIGVDLNKKEAIWQAPDNTIIVGGTINSDISATFKDYISYDTKTLIENGVHVKTPDWLPSGFVKIDEEIIGYERKDEYRLYNLTRGAYDTEVTSHASGSRIREVRVFNIAYQSKPSAVLENPFITAVLFDGTVDIDRWRPGVYGAELVISRNEFGDAFLIQKLQNTDPLNNLNNYVSVVGTPLISASSDESIEFESAEYAESIRRYGIKQIEFTNRFINSSYLAKQYADYFLQHFLNPVPIIEVAAMGNPMLKLGDRVRIVTFNRMGMSQEDFWIEKLDMNYSGGIDQNITLRKVS